MSPEELMHCVIFRIVEAIEAGEPASTPEKWRQCLLNMSFEFQLYQNEQAIDWDDIQMREDYTKKMQLARTTLERILEVSSVADDLFAASGCKKQTTVGNVISA